MPASDGFAAGGQESSLTPAEQLVAATSAILRDGSAGAFGSVPAGGAPALDAAGVRVKRAVQASAYEALAAELPAALGASLALRSVDPGPEQDGRVADLFAVAAEAMVKFGRVDLAGRAADLAEAHARASDDPAVLAGALQMQAIFARKTGRRHRAVALVVQGADELPAVPGDRLLSLKGSLLCTAAYTAAQTGDRSGADDLLAAAGRLAQFIAAPGDDDFTEFGPTNVLFYRMGVADALGDPGLAIRIAREVPLGEVTHRERRVRFWLDVALASWHLGHASQCLDALLRAERIAADEVRSRDRTRVLVAHLLDGRRRMDGRRLRGLARRVGFKP